MNNLWNYIAGLNLSARNRKWLSERLVSTPPVAKTKKKDSTLMTKEEFFARIEEASKGPIYECESVEDLDRLIRSAV